MKKKISLMLLCSLILVTLLCTSSYAYSVSTLKPSVVISGTESTVKTVLGVMQWTGYIISIGMIIWVGIKYLMTGAGEKAKAKETLIPIVIGAVLVAGASTITYALFQAIK